MDTKVRSFELTMWPHMRAAYNLARWLVRNDQDAEDIVQDSFLKAYKAQESFRGSDSRVWMLSIVRNTALDFLRRYKTRATVSLGDQDPRAGRPGARSGARIARTTRAANRCGKLFRIWSRNSAR